MAISGKSKSFENPYGVRRLTRGRYIAPKSLRKQGIIYLENCTHDQLVKAGVEIIIV